MINGILPIEFVRFLSKKYLFKKIYLYKIESAFNDYQNKKINYEMFTDIIINNYAKGLKGQKETVIKIEAESFIESIKDKIFEYSIDLITLIKQIGKVVAITGSPIELVDAIQKILPFDEIFATKINCVKGVYSGKVDFNCAKLESKKVVINKYLINKKIYLKFGFGDTLSDLAIFKVVKTPVIFGNNKKLINIAKKNNWLIITDEKKVISIIKSYLK